MPDYRDNFSRVCRPIESPTSDCAIWKDTKFDCWKNFKFVTFPCAKSTNLAFVVWSNSRWKPSIRNKIAPCTSVWTWTRWTVNWCRTPSCPVPAVWRLERLSPSANRSAPPDYCVVWTWSKSIHWSADVEICCGRLKWSTIWFCRFWEKDVCSCTLGLATEIKPLKATKWGNKFVCTIVRNETKFVLL